MEQQEIEVFLTLAEELHFGRTADRLRISRPRVSQMIQKLERRIGGPLFERTSRRVALTPLGQQLRDDLAPAHQQLQDGLRRAIATARGIDGLLRVGFVGASLGKIAFEIVDIFRARYPSCEVLPSEQQTGELFAPLRDDKVDILITRFPVEEPDLTAGPVVISGPATLAVSPQDPVAQRESISLNELTQHTFLIVEDAPDYWQDAHTPPYAPDGTPLHRDRGFVTFQEALALVSTGRFVTLVGAQVPQFYLRADIAYVPVDDAPPRQFGLIWRTAGATAQVRAFAETATEVLSGRAHGETFRTGPVVAGGPPESPLESIEYQRPLCFAIAANDEPCSRWLFQIHRCPGRLEGMAQSAGTARNAAARTRGKAASMGGQEKSDDHAHPAPRRS